MDDNILVGVHDSSRAMLIMGTAVPGTILIQGVTSNSIELPSRSLRTIELDDKHWYHHTIAFMNHSCDPNAFFAGDNLVALKDIDTGDEVTINYLETEDEISNPFACACGAVGCIGVVGEDSLCDTCHARGGVNGRCWKCVP